MEEAVFQQQIAQGKSPEYAKAYASKISEGREELLRNPDLKRNQEVNASPFGPTLAKAASNAPKPELRKRSLEDYTILKSIGEGSYSTVYLATDKETNVQVAVKILEKSHIMKEKKSKYVMTEKEVFNVLNHPLFVRLHCTFQDSEKLYFVLSFAKNGELLRWIQKLGSFDEACTKFYAAELVLALEFMHSKGVIHRDLKPENILLDENMHIQITDFGTAKLIASESDDRANSFVGTAQYVSPELLSEKMACKSSDLWALGCIIYQLLAGAVPFRAGNEYLTFKKITALDYEIPQGFPKTAKDLVENLLKLSPAERLGSDEMGDYGPLKRHPFFEGVDWDNLISSTPPTLDAYLPAASPDEKALHGHDGADDEMADLDAAVFLQKAGAVDVKRKRDVERQTLLSKQEKESPWQSFMNPNELIIKSGLVDKRKGLFAKRRQLILTDGPRLVYVDPENMEVKGEIPWSEEIYPQFKNMKIFFIHTPQRTYYLEDVERTSITWVDTIQQMLRLYKAEKAQKTAAQ